MFQALVLVTPVPLGQQHSGGLGDWPSVCSQAVSRGTSSTAHGLPGVPSRTCRSDSGHSPPRRAAPHALASVGSQKGLKAFKCTCLNANIPSGLLTPLGPFESSSLRLFLLSSCQALYRLQRRDRTSKFVSNSSSLKPSKRHCKTFWLQTPSCSVVQEGKGTCRVGGGPGSSDETHTQRKWPR